MNTGFSPPNRFPVATLARAWRMRHTHRLATVATMTRRFTTIPFRGSVLPLTFLVLAFAITAGADKALTFRFQGRHYRLTDVHGRVVRGVLA